MAVRHDPPTRLPREASPPPAWQLAPGEPLSVGVIGSDIDAGMLRRALPVGWVVGTILEIDEAALTSSGAHLICVTGSGDTSTDPTGVRRLSEAAGSAGIPTVAYARASDGIRLAMLGSWDTWTRSVIVGGIDHHDLATVFRDVAVRPVFEYIRSVIRVRLSATPIVRLALERMVMQAVPSAPVALEQMVVGAGTTAVIPFRRHVQDLTSFVGSSLSHLEDLARSVGIPLSEFARRNTILHGMAVYSGRNSDEVAYRLGFATGEGWRMLVRRNLDQGLVELRSVPLGFHGHRLLQLV